MRSLSIRMFKIMRQLGHEIVAWDEEALIHPPPDTYFSRRLSPEAIEYVSHLFAWGQENVDLLRQYPDLPEKTPIHITGNPRGDMLRPEMHPYFEEEVKRLRETYGDFILINTNFPDVNAFAPSFNLFLPSEDPREQPRFGQAGLGMSRDFAEGLRDHKQAILDDFIRLVPALQRAFPGFTIVVRPHPSENDKIYHDLAQQCERVRVTNEGNIIPWLLAMKVMVHNGCTTGVEAYALGVPAVTYQATVNDLYDYEFQGLANLLSHQCFNFEELQETLTQIFAGKLGAADGEERQDLMDHYLAAREGPLACERMIDVLEESGYGKKQPPTMPFGDYVQGWTHNKLRTAVKHVNMRRPGPNNKLAYHDRRFPEISVEEIEKKISRFGHLLNRFEAIRVAQHSRHIFGINK
jgi:surface carbohydrate biosynthesis protein